MSRIKKAKQKPTPARLERLLDAEGIRALAERLEVQLHSIRRSLRRRLEAEFARGQVTGPQQLVMAALIDSKGLSLKKLSEKVGLAHSTVSGIVDRLELRGMIDRTALSSDRRVTQIVPSDNVLHFLKNHMPELTLHPLLKALHRASPAELEAVRAGIDTLEKLLQRR